MAGAYALAVRPRLRHWGATDAEAQAIRHFLIWEPTHRVMQTRQFANLRRRAERDDNKETP